MDISLLKALGPLRPNGAIKGTKRSDITKECASNFELNNTEEEEMTRSVSYSTTISQLQVLTKATQPQTRQNSIQSLCKKASNALDKLGTVQNGLMRGERASDMLLLLKDPLEADDFFSDPHLEGILQQIEIRRRVTLAQLSKEIH